MALQFDEVNDYLTIADHADLTLPNGDWCICIWTRVPDNSGTQYQYLLSTATPGTTNSFNLYLSEASQPFATDDFTFSITDGTPTTYSASSTSNPGGDGLDRLIVLQRSTGDSEVQMWLVEAGGTPTKAASTADTSMIAVNPGAWYVGARADLNANRFYGGAAGHLFKADVALTTDQLTALGAGVLPHRIIVDGSLKLYVPLWDTGAGLNDLSGGAHNASVGNAPSFVDGFPTQQLTRINGGAPLIEVASGFQSAWAINSNTVMQYA